MADKYTVEAALKELREMCPGQDASIEFFTNGQIHIDIWQHRDDDADLPLRDNYFDADSLDAAMAQVKQWRESQKES
jgi:hypothetical protein